MMYNRAKMTRAIEALHWEVCRLREREQGAKFRADALEWLEDYLIKEREFQDVTHEVVKSKDPLRQLAATHPECWVIRYPNDPEYKGTDRWLGLDGKASVLSLTDLPLARCFASKTDALVYAKRYGFVGHLNPVVEKLPFPEAKESSSNA